MRTYILLALVANALIYLWLWFRYWREANYRGDDNKTSDDTEDPSKILGRCLTVERETTPKDAKSTPQAATKAKSESSEKKDSMFVDGNDKETAKRNATQVSSSEMDKTFENTNINPDDIDIQYVNNLTQDEIDDEMECVSINTSEPVEFATGALFSEIDEATKTSGKENSSHQELVTAGRTFIQIEGNDMYNQIIQDSNIRAKRISEMMSLALREVDIPMKITKPKVIIGIENFDIRDYV